MAIIYKILPEALWQAAQRSGSFAGAAIDLTDGYIHFSTAGQAVETARRHFHGQRELLLVAFEADLFPHLYAVLDPALALWVKPLPWAGGQHDFPEGWTA